MLFENGSIPKTRVVESEDFLETMLSEQLTAEANVAAARSRQAEATRSLEDLILTEREGDLAELRKTLREAEEVAIAIKDLEARRAALQIRAPVAGIVQSQAVSVPGEVLEPGGLIAEILPTNVDLIAEVRLTTRDIGSVEVGDKVALTVTSYDQKQFGRISGKVASLSPSSVTERDGPPYYKATVSLDAQHVGAGAGSRPLRSGMVVQAEIVIASRTIAQYMFKPLDRTISNAMREQ